MDELGRLAESEQQVFRDFADRIPLAGRRVVEIGGAVPNELLAAEDVDRWWSIDPRNPTAAAPDGALFRLNGRSEAIPLDDHTADAAFSSNAFQFVDLPSTLNELKRVLKPGGVLYAHFGPIWSGPDGHQLEYVQYQGRDLLFWRDTLLPPYAHLQYERDELLEVLLTALPEELARLLVWHVHDSSTVNRLFLEDYLDVIEHSGFERTEIAVSEHLDYVIEPPHYSSPPARTLSSAQVQAIVQARSGRSRRLGVRDMRMVLRAPA